MEAGPRACANQLPTGEGPPLGEVETKLKGGTYMYSPVPQSRPRSKFVLRSQACSNFFAADVGAQRVPMAIRHMYVPLHCKEPGDYLKRVFDLEPSVWSVDLELR